MVGILKNIFEYVQLDFVFLKEILEGFDKFIIFGVLDLNVSVIQAVSVLAARIHARIKEGSIGVLMAKENVAEQENVLLNLIEQIAMKCLCQNQTVILDDFTVPSPSTLKTQQQFSNVKTSVPSDMDLKIVD